MFDKILQSSSVDVMGEMCYNVCVLIDNRGEKMAQTAFSIRMDEGLKRDFSQFCENIGMTMSTAFVVFAKATLRNRKIPFEIYDTNEECCAKERLEVRNRAMKAFENIRSGIQSRGEEEMTLDEINAEIASARKGRRLSRKSH